MPLNESLDHFNSLLKKYLNNTASSEEAAFVEKYYQYFEHNNDLIDSLPENEVRQIQSRLFEKIKNELSQESTKNIFSKNSWKGWAIAASVLLIAGSIIFFQVNRKRETIATNENKNLAASKEIPPGSNKAIITLNDGSKVLLDDSNTGLIAKQGNTQVIKLPTGEVVYKNKELNKKTFINTMTTPRGGRYQLMLSDGTKVWMNSESSITYPTAFREAERRVKITGEVYFEVAKNEKQPFFVSLNNGTEIRVLGTHFNVNTYLDNGAISTTLLEGSVLVTNKNELQILKPGQQAQVKNSAISVKSNIDTSLVMAWKNGYFSFNNTELEMVMKQLARWYDVNVIYEGKAPLMKFWGGISMNSSLSQVLKVLEESKINFRVENKNIIVLTK